MIEIGDSRYRQKIKREKWTWSTLHHPNILPLYGWVDDDDRFQPFGAFISPVGYLMPVSSERK
jgi:hypothetical protein